jgi:hypothetical protein
MVRACELPNLNTPDAETLRSNVGNQKLTGIGRFLESSDVTDSDHIAIQTF